MVRIPSSSKTEAAQRQQLISGLASDWTFVHSLERVRTGGGGGGGGGEEEEEEKRQKKSWKNRMKYKSL